MPAKRREIMLPHFRRGCKADLKGLWCQASLGALSLASVQVQSSGSVWTPLHFRIKQWMGQGVWNEAPSLNRRDLGHVHEAGSLRGVHPKAWVTAAHFTHLRWEDGFSLCQFLKSHSQLKLPSVGKHCKIQLVPLSEGKEMNNSGVIFLRRRRNRCSLKKPRLIFHPKYLKISSTWSECSTTQSALLVMQE